MRRSGMWLFALLHWLLLLFCFLDVNIQKTVLLYITAKAAKVILLKIIFFLQMSSIKVSSLDGKNWTTAWCIYSFLTIMDQRLHPVTCVNTILFFMQHTFCWNINFMYIYDIWIFIYIYIYTHIYIYIHIQLYIYPYIYI